jgi:AcrR family transcriptional regulator
MMDEAPSALYRYFPNRDALLTALIVDAYNDLGESVERALAPLDRASPRANVVTLASAIRTWALGHVQEYALIFGSPVPNYAAPASTIDAAARVPRALASILSRATLTERPFGTHPLPKTVLNGANLDELLGGASQNVQARCLVVWSAIFGLVSFELFGHFVGSVVENEEFFVRAVDDLSQHLGL